MIELLVSIAIIGLLVSLLSPSLKSVMTIARQSQCLTQLKNYGVVMSVYAVDHNGQLNTMRERDENRRLVRWYQLYEKYMSQEIRYCAQVDSTTEHRIDYGWNYSGAKVKGPNDLWGMGFYAEVEGGTYFRGHGIYIHQIADPDNLFALGDKREIGVPLSGYLGPVGFNHPDIHMGEANILYLDGHTDSFFSDYFKSNEARSSWTRGFD